jgi:hypothetical protein
MAEDRADIERDLQVLEAGLKQLEAEYNMFFSGRLPRPPWETRSRVDALLKQLDRQHISNYGVRFRFTTLQTRYARFVDLWDRGLRAREEGRPGPFNAAAAARAAAPAAVPAPDRLVHVTSFRDPAHEADKLRDLYDRVSEARREAGQEAISFGRFADLIRTQVSTLREQGGSAVAFRVAMKDGKLAFTAKALKGLSEEE